MSGQLGPQHADPVRAAGAGEGIYFYTLQIFLHALLPAQVIPIGEPIPAISASPGDDTGGGEDRLFNLFQGGANK